MDSQQAASMTALILTGVSKDRAAAKYGQDPEFSDLWDKISSDIDRQRQENPKIQFDIPNEFPDLGGGDTTDTTSAPAASPAPEAPAPIEDGPAVANLKKKAPTPKAQPKSLPPQ